MKNLFGGRSIVWIGLLFFAISSCGPAVSTETVNMELKLTGDMLFEGANSLQFAGDGQLAELTESLGITAEALEKVSVAEAAIELEDASRAITESLLLQVVSDDQELLTIGTLNPLPDGNQFTLSLAEDVAILDYLKDSGTTWVLDLNITEDYMDEMLVIGKLELTVAYVPIKN